MRLQPFGASLVCQRSVCPVEVEARGYHSRRDMLKSSAFALLPLAIPSATDAANEQQPMTANGGTDPYPIPWLDKNGSQSASWRKPRTFAYIPF